ncbi:MAG: T9SS type A sorting domain-containing protein [Edaphocola sp.]
MLNLYNASGQRQMEKLGRGVVATRTGSSRVLVSWRLLGTEPWDIGFNVYRSANGGTPVKINDSVLTAGTNFEDSTVTISASNRYTVSTVLNGVEGDTSSGYTLAANSSKTPYYKIKINNTTGYRVEYANVGDFDGDGEYDYVMHKTPLTDETLPDLVEAYKRDGTFLWTINMGANSLNRNGITPGSTALDAGHGDNWTVYDINNDGKSELILRTANGVTFADSTVLTNTNDSQQFISVINGMTGVEISRTTVGNPYLSQGPMNGHMGIAYLDGIHPSVVWMSANRNDDETFNELIYTWNWSGTTLVAGWTFDLAGQPLSSAHQIKIFDVDGDGKDEIMPMAFVVDDDGTLLYNMRDEGIYHGDRFCISDLDPKRPGLEVYGVQQGYSELGLLWYYIDAKTGKLLLSQSDPSNRDVGRGMAADFDPRYLGLELYTFVGSLYNVQGEAISSAIPNSFPNQRMYWDADLGGELLDGGKIIKWNYLTETETRLYTANSSSGNGASATVPLTTPPFYADIIGDWREEAVYESSDHEYLIVVETPYATTERIYTLPHNPGYRNDMCVKGYYQSNNVDYYLGYDMQQPPIPPIQLATKYWVGTSNIWDSTTANWNDGTSAASFADGDTIMFDIRGNSSDTIALNTTVAPKKIWIINPEGKDYIVGETGKITGTCEVWKAKEGSFTLIGNHDYTGATVVTEGQLNIDGSLQSPVTVKGLGTFGGRGVLAAGLVLNKGVNKNGGRIIPGLGATAETIGSLTITGNLDVAGDNNFEFDVVPGSTKINDSLIVTGNLTFAGVNSIVVNFADNNFVPGTYTLMKCSGTLTATSGNFVVSGMSGVSKDLLIENNEIKIRINDAGRSPASLVWSGAVDTLWDFTTQNFTTSNTSTAFVSGDTLTFDATAVQRNVVVSETVYPAAITFNADSSYTLQGTDSIGGSGGITKNGQGEVAILSTGNTYSGKTIINGGTLTVAKIGKRNEPSSIGAADSAAQNIQINKATLVINENCITNRAFTLTDTCTINIPTAANYAIFIGDITGGGSLVKDGPGSLYMVGSKSFSGDVTIKSGQLNLRTIEGNNYGLGTGNSVTIEDATLALDDLSSYSAPEWNIVVPAGKNATLLAHGLSNMKGTLTGQGTLNIDIPYIRTNFYGDWSAFTGQINIEENQFRIANTYGYANAAINIDSGMIRVISGASTTIAIGELSGAAGTSLASDKTTTNWQIGAKNTDATFAGDIAKSSLIKVGTGTFTLTGNNTYTGTTSVNAGRLLVNNATGTLGAGTGTVSVASGAILGGTGFIKGSIAISSGGKLQPGSDSIGTLTDSSNVTFATGAIAEMEVNKDAATYDVLKATGTIQYNGTLKVTNTGNTGYAAGDSFKLFDAAGYSGSFATLEPTIPASGLLWDVSELATTGTLKIKLDSSTALPLQLLSFTGRLQGDTINLAWKTTNETNVGYFAVERLNDGEQTFKEVGRVAAQDNEYNSYGFKDAKGESTSVIYYHLKIVDEDGKYQYSPIVAIAITAKTGIALYPNPVTNLLRITHGTSTVGAKITVWDIKGQAVLYKTGNANSTETWIDVSALPAGTYFLKLDNGTQIQALKFIKE